MWSKLTKQIAVEREALNRAIDTHRPLLEKCAREAATQIEVSALAALLHSFYTGIENNFKRITVELDDPLPQGEQWHTELLEAMTRPTPHRAAVLSESLCECLRNYLDFRHLFRHAYPFELRWSKMAPLVLECEAILRRLETELDAFAESMDSRGDAGSCARN